MFARNLRFIYFGIAGAFLLTAPLVHAQFAANIKTNTINGVISNWVGNGSYVVGSNTFKDVLRVINSGILSNGTGYLGYATGGSNNVAVVTDPGSVWTNSGNLIAGYSGARNSLTISNGGAVFDVIGQLGVNSVSSSNNVVTVTGAGSAWNNQSDLEIGVVGAGNTLTIANGGAVNISASGGISFVGYDSSSGNNIVIVAGAGSVWNAGSGGDLILGYESAGNILTVTNGGTAFSEVVEIGAGVSGNKNTVTVTGAGSVVSNSFGLSAGVIVGNEGVGNTLAIDDGGAVVSYSGALGEYPMSSNNLVIVTGSGSVWDNNGPLYIGYTGSSNVLRIAGGSVAANTVVISGSTFLSGSGTNNVIQVNSGSLFVTNALGSGALVVSQGDALLSPAAGKGELILNGGSVTVDNLVATNGVNSVVTINGGTLAAGSAFIDNGQDFVIGSTSSNATYVPLGGTQSFHGHFVVRRGALMLDTGTVTVGQLVLTNATGAVNFESGRLDTAGTAVTNGQEFAVGDGTTGANFHLLGGEHSFADGLRIRNASTLTGCGTVNGSVTIDSGGTVYTDCGTLTFTGTVTNNFALGIDGGLVEFYGTVVNNGGILLYNGGTTNFHGTFINNGVVLNAGDTHRCDFSRVDDDMVINVLSATGFRYQLQIATSWAPAVWTNSGAAQSGTGGVLTFVDPGGATNQPSRFYHVDVIWP